MKTLLIILGAFSAMMASAVVLANLGLPYRPLGQEFLQNSPYDLAEISAEVSGSTTPDQLEDATENDFITNGDFSIFWLVGAGNTTLGDGIDEVTVWEFDFTADPMFESFPTSEPLESARLTLTLTPMAPLFNNDEIRVSGLSPITPPVYGELPIGTTSTIEIELLDFHTSGELLGVLNAGKGDITITSLDDAIVSEAELVLVSQAPAGS